MQYRGGPWRVELPADWSGEIDEDSHLFAADDGYGELTISGVVRDEDVTVGLLKHLAREHLEAGAQPEDCEYGDFRGFYLNYQSEDEVWQEWYLYMGPVLVFASYVCIDEDEGLEDDIVENILDSLRVVDD